MEAFGNNSQNGVNINICLSSFNFCYFISFKYLTILYPDFFIQESCLSHQFNPFPLKTLQTKFVILFSSCTFAKFKFTA